MVQPAKVRAAFLLFLLLVPAAACTYEEGTDEPTRAVATESGALTVLRIGTNDDGLVPTRGQIEEFARQVAERSNGELAIEPVFRAGGDQTREWDQVVARKAISGELAMAVVPARAWDTEGVDSFRALSAPFLVTSDALIKEAVKPELADGMLAGLKDVGLTGLALFPEGPRPLFSFGSPILTPADVKGMVIRAPKSATNYSVLEALGAVPADIADEEFGNEVEAGNVGGAESSLAYADGLPGAHTKTGRAVVTGNLVLYSKINTLVINAKVMDGLDEGQRQILRDSAAFTRDWSTSLLSTLAAEARRYCEGGGTVVMATEGDLEAFHAATAPLTAELEKDHRTKVIIERLRGFAAGAPAEAAVEPCDFDTY